MKRVKALIAFTMRAAAAAALAAARAVRRSTLDLFEIAGVLLIAAALWHVHIALALGVPGVYLLLVANFSGPRERGGR